MTAPGTSGNLGFGGLNPGPGSSVLVQTQALMGPPGSSSSGGIAGLFNNPITAALSTTVDNWSPTGWVPGVTNALNVNASGTPQINGINTIFVES